MTKKIQMALIGYGEFFWYNLTPLTFVEGMFTAKQHKNYSDWSYAEIFLSSWEWSMDKNTWMRIIRIILNNLLLWPSHLLDPGTVKNLWDILDRHNRQHSLPPSSKPQLREYLLEEWCSSLEYNSSVESVHTLGTKVFSAVWCFLLFGALWYSLQCLLSSDQFVLSAALTSVDTPSCH